VRAKNVLFFLALQTAPKMVRQGEWAGPHKTMRPETLRTTRQNVPFLVKLYWPFVKSALRILRGMQRKLRGFPQLCRQSVGVVPVMRLKERLKWGSDMKPTSKATSLTRRLGFCSICLARSIRRRER